MRAVTSAEAVIAIQTTGGLAIGRFSNIAVAMIMPLAKQPAAPPIPMIISSLKETLLAKLRDFSRNVTRS